MEDVQAIAQKIIDNVEQVIIGKHEAVQLTVIALLCEGHLLIEDVPGTGKTMLAKSVSKSLGCEFRRIQFTPDMLPSDVTGVSVFNQKTREFEFRPGPVMAQIVLTDEINRATPKTQSALLEAMEERQITVDGVTYPMEQPFLVLATQNPIEYEGTFPLPEAQLDRFMMRISLGYPSADDEITMLRPPAALPTPSTSIEQVVSARGVDHGPEAHQGRVYRRSGQGVYRQAGKSHAQAPRCLPGRQPAGQHSPCTRQARPAQPSWAATMSSPTTSRPWPW